MTKKPRFTGLNKFLLEFLSIFIGVFAAFALDNWNEDRKDHITEMSILQEILLPFPDHVRIQVVLGADNIEFLVALKNRQDHLGFEFSSVLFSWHDGNLLFRYLYYTCTLKISSTGLNPWAHYILLSMSQRNSPLRHCHMDIQA